MTTEPSFLTAAKADLVENILLTPPARSEETALEFPPYVECPQVATEPSFLRAAKALAVANTRLTPPEMCREIDPEEYPRGGWLPK